MANFAVMMAVRTVFIITLRKTNEGITRSATANITNSIIAIALTRGTNIRNSPKAGRSDVIRHVTKNSGDFNLGRKRHEDSGDQVRPISYERVPETPDIKPPKKGIQFFGGFHRGDYSLGFPSVVWQYVIV